MAPVPERARPAFQRVVAYFWPYGVEGWIEYWVWDLVMGRRDWPHGILSSEDLIVDLHQLIREAKVWFVWSFSRQVWGVVPLKVWIWHTKTTNYLEAQEKCRVFQERFARVKEEATRQKASGVKEGH